MAQPGEVVPLKLPKPRQRRAPRIAPSEPVNVPLVELAFAALGRYVALSLAHEAAEAAGTPMWVRDPPRECDESLNDAALEWRVDVASDSLTLAAAALGEGMRMRLARRVPAELRAFFNPR